jgi:hypothetical protein
MKKNLITFLLACGICFSQSATKITPAQILEKTPATVTNLQNVFLYGKVSVSGGSFFSPVKVGPGLVVEIVTDNGVQTLLIRTIAPTISLPKFLTIKASRATSTRYNVLPAEGYENRELQVFRNGILQNSPEDYTRNSANEIQFTTPIDIEDLVLFIFPGV